MKKKQVTLLELAKRLNLSPSTVSRALNGRHRISEETRQKVRTLADALDYQPNPSARSLRESKTWVLGVLIPEIAHGFFSTAISGIEEVAIGAGYNIMICQSHESSEREKAVADALLASRVDGLLFCPSQETRDFSLCNQFRRRDIPVVFFDRFGADVEASRVVVDDFGGAREVVNHLIANGYRRIAHLAGPENLTNSQARLEGYLTALREHNITPDETLVRHLDLNHLNSREYGRYLLDLPEPPDAIFCFHDNSAFEIMTLAKERGVRIPDQLAIAGFSNEYASVLVEPSLTTVGQPAFALGSAAASLITAQLHQEEHDEPIEYQTITLPTELIIRDSTRRKA
ncbi:MAG: LacI family DNA-binding transcriptional regulator [Bacteroidia bacterium]|nr:LacI family DNA-binding transcriptional regulator [Bacteroidia bacterium]